MQHERRRRCARQGCSNRFDVTGRRRFKLYCSLACRMAAYRYRSGRTKRPQLHDRYECRRGHERTPENTAIKPDGTRECRICKRERNAESRRRKGHRNLSETCRNGHSREHSYMTYPPSRPEGKLRCRLCLQEKRDGSR